MRQQPHLLWRRVTGAVIAGGLLVAAAAFPFLTPGGEVPPAPAESAPQAAARQPGPEQEEPASKPGIVMVVSPSLSGDLLITETVRFPGSTTGLVLGPPRVKRAGAQFAQTTAQATSVSVSSPGQAVSFPRGAVQRQTRVSLPPTRTAEVSYRLVGATVRSVPSRPGRATGVVTPLLRGLEPDLPVRIVVTGPAVLNLTCPLLPTSEQACRTGASPAAQTRKPLPLSDAVVTVQLDLRRP